jgi:hypothetical protein
MARPSSSFHNGGLALPTSYVSAGLGLAPSRLFLLAGMGVINGNPLLLGPVPWAQFPLFTFGGRPGRTVLARVDLARLLLNHCNAFSLSST